MHDFDDFRKDVNDDERLDSDERYSGLFSYLYGNGVSYEVLIDAFQKTDSYDSFFSLLREMVDGEESDVVSEDDPDLSDPVYSVLKKENDQLQGMLQERSDEVIELEKKIFSLTKDNEHSSDEVISLSNEIKQLKGMVSVLESKCIRYQKRYESLMHKNDELRLIIENMPSVDHSDEIQILSEENESLRENYNMLNDRIISLNEENMELQSKISVLENDLSIERSIASVNSEFGTDRDVPSMSELSRFSSETSSGSYYDEKRVNDDIDYEKNDLISMVPDEHRIKEKRSIFVKLVKKFKDMEFSRKSRSEQNNVLFLKLMEKQNVFSKDDYKYITQALHSSKDLRRVDLYHMLEEDASAEECVEFCRAAVA